MNLRLALLDVRTCAIKGFCRWCGAFVTRIRDFVPVRGRSVRGDSRSVRVGGAKTNWNSKKSIVSIRYDLPSLFHFFVSSMTLHPAASAVLQPPLEQLRDCIRWLWSPFPHSATKFRVFSSSFKNNEDPAYLIDQIGRSSIKNYSRLVHLISRAAKNG
jgi:hypothetical protein